MIHQYYTMPTGLSAHLPNRLPRCNYQRAFQAVKVPKEHVHIQINQGQTLLLCRLGGEDESPHAAQIRVLCTQDLSLRKWPSLPSSESPFQKRPPTLFFVANPDQLAIDGLLLPD
jgi:hypothetical protein